MTDRFICCNCGRAREEKEYGSTLTGRYVNTGALDFGKGTFVFCRECWEAIKADVKAGMATDEKCFQKGAFVPVIRCVTCGEVLDQVYCIPQGTLVAGEHENHVTGCSGTLRAPFCPECWKRITANVRADMVVVRDDS